MDDLLTAVLAMSLPAYWCLIVFFAIAAARYGAIGNAMRNWARILIGQNTVDQDVAGAVASGFDPVVVNFVVRFGTRNENQDLRDLLLPTAYHAKFLLSHLVSLVVVLLGFVWFPWYWPIVAIPSFVIISKVVYPVFNRDYKKSAIRRLRSHQRRAERSGELETAEVFGNMILAVENAEHSSARVANTRTKNASVDDTFEDLRRTCTLAVNLFPQQSPLEEHWRGRQSNKDAACVEFASLVIFFIRDWNAKHDDPIIRSFKPIRKTLESDIWLDCRFFDRIFGEQDDAAYIAPDAFTGNRCAIYSKCLRDGGRQNGLKKVFEAFFCLVSLADKASWEIELYPEDLDDQDLMEVMFSRGVMGSAVVKTLLFEEYRLFIEQTYSKISVSMEALHAAVKRNKSRGN